MLTLKTSMSVDKKFSLSSEVVFSRNKTIDALRGIAIVMIMLLHAIIMTPDVQDHTWITKIGGHLQYGVQLFFMISGWVIVASYENGLERGDGNVAYLAKRISKIYPLYFIFLNINIILFLLSSEVFDAPNFYKNSVSYENLSIFNYILHIGMLQGFVPSSLHTLVDGSWSIVCELYFYIMVPFLLYKYTKNTADSLLAFLISIIISIVFSMLIGKNIGQSVYYGYYAFPTQLPLFLLGIYCYRLNQSINVPLPTRHQMLIAITVLVLFLGSSELKVSPLGGHIYIGILFAFIMIFVSLDSSNYIINILRVLGRQSYALFFLHLLFLKEFYKYLFGSQYFDFYVALAINIVVSIGLSWLFSWLIFDRIDRFFVKSLRYRRVF